MKKKKFKINPKVWSKEYTFEEFKQLNPTITENLLINYYNKYLQEYAEDRSRHLSHFNDTKEDLSKELKLLKEVINPTSDGDGNVGPTGGGRKFRSPLSQIQNSLDFNGDDEYARAGLDGQIPSDGTLKPYSQLTFATWVEANNLYNVGSGGGYFTIGSTLQNGGYRMHHYHKKFEFKAVLDDGDGTKSNHTVTTGFAAMKPGAYWAHTDGALNGSGWHYMVGTYDGRTMKLYVDGQLGDEGLTTAHTKDPYGVQSTGESGSIGAIYYDEDNNRHTLDFTIGSNSQNSGGAFSSTAEFFSGSIAEVAVWDVALDATTIKDIYDNNASGSGAKYDLSYQGYNNGENNSEHPYDLNDEGLSYKNVGRYANNLQGWWEMDENTGTNVADSSGNGNDGTFSSGNDNDPPEWITVMEVTETDHQQKGR